MTTNQRIEEPAWENWSRDQLIGQVKHVRKLLSANDTTVSYKCAECGSFHLRVVAAAADRPAVETADDLERVHLIAALVRVTTAQGLEAAVSAAKAGLAHVKRTTEKANACQHDLLKPNCTVSVDADHRGGSCKVCLDSWRLSPDGLSVKKSD